MSKSNLATILALAILFLPLTYLVANFFWFNSVEGHLYIETDRLIPLTTFTPPYIHSCCGDQYAPGWDEQKVARVGIFYIFGVIASSVTLSLVLYKPITRLLKSLEKEIIKNT